MSGKKNNTSENEISINKAVFVDERLNGDFFEFCFQRLRNEIRLHINGYFSFNYRVTRFCEWQVMKA